MSSNQGKLPSTAELERFIKEKTLLVFNTTDGKEHVGTLRWFDETAFALTVAMEKQQKHVTLLKQAVIGYGPLETGK